MQRLLIPCIAQRTPCLHLPLFRQVGLIAPHTRKCRSGTAGAARGAADEPQRPREEAKQRHKPALVQCLAPQPPPIGFSARQPSADEKLPTTPGLGIIILVACQVDIGGSKTAGLQGAELLVLISKQICINRREVCSSPKSGRSTRAKRWRWGSRDMGKLASDQRTLNDWEHDG